MFCSVAGGHVAFEVPQAQDGDRPQLTLPDHGGRTIKGEHGRICQLKVFLGLSSKTTLRLSVLQSHV